MNNFDRWESWGEEVNWYDELRNSFKRYRAQDAENYKPTIKERIICYLKFNQLKKGMK